MEYDRTHGHGSEMKLTDVGGAMKQEKALTKQMYMLGGIGAGGHWYRRLHPFLKDRLLLHKAVGITPYEDKRHLLEQYGITPEKYFQIVPGSPIPEGFFEGIHAVHIASHNQFHFDQTKQALENGKVAVVEKTLAVDETQFEEIVGFIKSNGFANKVAPHVHYLDKALTIEFKEKLLPEAMRRYGRIRSVVATFFEDVCEEDIRRSWLFRRENGGIFMDWIHPSAMLVHAAGASFEECEEVETFIMNPAYDSVNPTAVQARFRLAGERFAPGARATIRVGKGFPSGTRFKRLSLAFEKGGALDLAFVDSEKEFTVNLKGSWVLREGDQIVDWGSPTGAPSYAHMVERMVEMMEGGRAPLSLEEIERLFMPVWLFHRASEGVVPHRERSMLESFTAAGLGMQPWE